MPPVRRREKRKAAVAAKTAITKLRKNVSPEKLRQWIDVSIRDNKLKRLRELLTQKKTPSVFLVTNDDIHKALRTAVAFHKPRPDILFEQLRKGKSRYRSRKTWANPTSLLEDAVTMGNMDVLRVLVEKHRANINQYNIHTGTTPLQSARHSIEMSRFLLQNLGADPNPAGFVDPPCIHPFPLYSAVNDRNAELVRLYLEYGANPNCIGQDECTVRKGMLVHKAVEHGDADIVDLRIQHGARVNVYWDIVDGDTAAQRMVLNRFLDGRGPNNNQAAPSHLLSMCRTLAQHATAKLSSDDAYRYDITGLLLLSLVHTTDKSSIEMLLLEILRAADSNANQLDTDFRVLAISFAIRYKKLSVCQWLVEFGVNMFSVIHDLHLAANMMIMIEEKVCPRTPRVPTLLQLAARINDTVILDFCLNEWSRCFSASQGRGNHGDYPIHVVCCEPHISLSALKYVLACHHDDHAVDVGAGGALRAEDGEQGLLPLLFAAMWDASLDVIYHLVRHCPDSLSIRQI